MTLQLSNWRIVDTDPGASPSTERMLGHGEGWAASSAPGDTYLALVAAGLLQHPFAGRNEAAAEWVRHREWWWHTRFAIDPAKHGETVELVFDGLDTFADIYLNGAKIGSSDNMFRQLRLDIAALVGPGEHDLALRFPPTAEVLGEREAPGWKNFSIFTTEGRALMRKAQYGWGWDWGPNLPTVGIWRPVRIERGEHARLTGIGFTTLSISDDAALVRIDIEAPGGGSVEVKLLDPDGGIVGAGTCHGSGSLTFTITEPRLWWTADLGAQPLYTLAAGVNGGPEEHRRVGIRTIVIDESPDPDEPGATFFRFVLNGIPIFAKGACWIPASSFIGAVTSDTYGDLVARAVEANMNMLRVWGGGVYEADAFYDACDAAGLLVWQDMMFACAAYPEDDAFVENVRAEVAEQARRLRTHPCLAVWCGNNENMVLNHFDNYLNGTDLPLPGASLFEHHIPEVLRSIDPATPYREGSPLGGPAPNSMRAGDVHDWTVWHGAAPVPDADPVGPLMAKGPEDIAYTRYQEDMARFVSEFGIHGAPDLTTLRRWLEAEDLAIDSNGFRQRIKDHGDKAVTMSTPIIGRPETIEEYVDFTMLLQAEGLKFGIEHFRRRKPHCSGSLIWQYNDCWPCVSWSLIDYDGMAKASYFAVKRVYAPILASFRRGGGDVVELWITNDTLEPVNDIAAITLAMVEGGEEWRVEVDFHVDANASAMVWQGTVSAATDRVLAIRSPANRFPANRLLLATVKDLALAPDPGLRWTVEDDRLMVTAKHYALSVQVTAEDRAIRFDDNYFDLAAGESRTITASGPLGASAVAVSSWADRRAASGGKAS